MLKNVLSRTGTEAFAAELGLAASLGDCCTTASLH